MRHVAVLLIVAGLALGAPHADSVCTRAEYLLFHRNQNRTWLDSSYALLRQLHEQEPRHEYCLYLWSRIHVQLGDNATGKAQRLELFGKSKAIAETLLQVDERNADAWCWWGVAQGRIGQTRGVLNSLFMVPGLKRAFGKALELDPRHPTALDAFGVLYYELPGFAGGSLAKSEDYLGRGIEAAPEYTLLRLDLAKVYIREKRWVAARTQLNAVIAATKPRYPADTELDDKPEARQLLTEIKDR